MNGESIARWMTLPVVFAFVSWQFGGCATIFTGTQDTITISATPETASIFKDGRLLGAGSVTFAADRSAFGTFSKIRVEANGYDSQEFQLDRRFNPAAIGNLTFVFSWTTDVLSGSVMKYSPTSYHVTLRPKTANIDHRSMYVDQFALLFQFRIVSELARGEESSIGLFAELAFPDDPAKRARLTSRLVSGRDLLLESPTPVAFLGAIRSHVREVALMARPWG
jgi:hypothetical protein